MASSPIVSNAQALQMARLYEQSPLFVSLFDATDTMRYANPAFRTAFDVAPGAEPTWTDLMRCSHTSGVGAAIKTDDLRPCSSPPRRGRASFPFAPLKAD